MLYFTAYHASHHGKSIEHGLISYLVNNVQIILLQQLCKRFFFHVRRLQDWI